jgi:hypothetical protein
MAHGDAREEKWRGNKRMEWVTSKRHVTAEHRLAPAVQTQQADVHNSPASSRLNWRPCRFKWARPFRWKTKSGFCACAITFQTQSTKCISWGGKGGQCVALTNFLPSCTDFVGTSWISSSRSSAFTFFVSKPFLPLCEPYDTYSGCSKLWNKHVVRT